MNPFFWFLVLLAGVVVWFVLREFFIVIGTAVSDLMQDTMDILNSDEAVEENDFEEIYGGNENE